MWFCAIYIKTMPLSSKAWQLNKINMIFFFPPWKELQQKCKFSGFCWERNYWGKFSSFSLFYIWSKAAECGNKTGLAVLMQLLQKFSTVSWMCDDTWKYGQNPTLAKEKNPQNPAITDFSPQNTLFFFIISSSNSVSCSNLRKIWRNVRILCKVRF